MHSQRFVAPGDKVLDNIGDYQMGVGLYEANKMIFASVAGYVNNYEFKTKADTFVKVIEVRRKETQADNELLPFVGAIVTCKVRAVGLRFAKCDILSVGDKVYKKKFAALLPKKKLKANEPELSQPFKDFVRPNDYILAKVCEDANIKDKFVISIAEDQLGVVLCRGRYGEEMTMVDWTKVVSTRTGKAEPRKLAIVPQLCLLKKVKEEVQPCSLKEVKEEVDA